MADLLRSKKISTTFFSINFPSSRVDDILIVAALIKSYFTPITRTYINESLKHFYFYDSLIYLQRVE